MILKYLVFVASLGFILQISKVSSVYVLNNKGAESFKRVCYFTNWAQYRSGSGKYTPADIDPTLCTHIIYAFAKLAGNQLATIEPNDATFYQQINNLKTQNRDLKTSLAVGGWSAGGAPFSAMTRTKASRTQFIQSSIKFLRAHGFDGLDIDWEFPTAGDKANFALLTKEINAAFTQEAASSGKERLFLSVAVSAGKSHIDSGYDVRTIGANVDFINLMTYDFHGSWERQTGETSPLFDTGANAQLNTAWGANYWAQSGAPKNKLIVGTTFYGHSFTLANPSNSGIGAPVTGAGQAGQFTGQRGVMSYPEICQMLESGGVDHWDDKQKVAYSVKGNQWVGHDNVRSITEKSEWIKKEGFGGGMVWSLDADDFKKTCASSTTTYPLLHAMKDVLGGGQTNSVTTTTPKPTTTTPTPTTATPKPTTAQPVTTTLMAVIQSSTVRPWTAAPAGPVTDATKQPAATTKQQPVWTAPQNVQTSAKLPPSSVSTPVPSSPTNPQTSNGAFSCSTMPDGYHPDPVACRTFYRCMSKKTFRFSCPPGTAYNPTLHECDWPYNVPNNTC